MNTILSNPLISIIVLSILVLLIIIFLVIYFLDMYIFYFHEYGHISKMIENLKKDIHNYEKEVKSNIIIQVTEYATFFNVITFKRKTYSNYFKYLENKRQESKYQDIIKDIAIGGYEFSKQLENYKIFHMLHTIFTISATISLTLIVVLALINKIIYIQLTCCVLIIIVMIFLPKKFYKLFYSIYRYRCKIGYGLKPINNTKKGMNDCYIYSNPNQFIYANIEEDKKYTKGKPKILLYIVINLNDIENIEPKTIYKNNIYKKITKNFSLSNKIY